ncbi:hypothetical protein EYF80_034271 [Liparis tanakae]|uniref:Uncharacterized protein n=1 Tax=Liparis tanakae TaxID=230148 RepID=A0A4Z2GQ85_9TELE|nr:hypothetical protein EYF80_034271 [Liparis tanakae]
MRRPRESRGGSTAPNTEPPSTLSPWSLEPEKSVGYRDVPVGLPGLADWSSNKRVMVERGGREGGRRGRAMRGDLGGKETESLLPSLSEGLLPSLSEGLPPSPSEGLPPSPSEGLPPSLSEGLPPSPSEGLPPSLSEGLNYDHVHESTFTVTAGAADEGSAAVDAQAHTERTLVRENPPGPPQEDIMAISKEERHKTMQNNAVMDPITALWSRE